jgi:hypothetical protein
LRSSVGTIHQSRLALGEVIGKPKITFGEMREMGVRGLLVLSLHIGQRSAATSG